jgi:predicted Zn-dependent protease
MIILHENLYSEALHIAEVIEKSLSIKSSLKSEDLSFLFKPITKFDGFWHSCDEISKHFYTDTNGKRIIVLTPRDIYYCDESKEDNYCFAYEQDNSPKTSIVISTARLKGEDDKPRPELKVAQELYLKRLAVLALHEIGHDIVKSTHLKEDVWVNAETGYSIAMGLHCPNNRCALYQVSDVQTPDPKKGYIRVGSENRFDTGLDDLISRLASDFFCEDCRRNIQIDEKYR